MVGAHTMVFFDNGKKVLYNHITSSIYPITWNTMDVVDNVSFTYDGTNYVKISNLILSTNELATSRLYLDCKGYIMDFNYVGGQNLMGVEVAMYIHRNGDNTAEFTIASVPTAGNYDGLIIEEPGLYVINLGHNNMGGLDGDATLEIPEYSDDHNIFPLTFNTKDVAGNTKVTLSQYESFVKISSTPLSLNELKQLSVSHNDPNTGHLLYERFGDTMYDELIDYGVIIAKYYDDFYYATDNNTAHHHVFSPIISVSASGNYGGIEIPEAGIYVADYYGMASMNTDITIDYVGDANIDILDNELPIECNKIDIRKNTRAFDPSSQAKYTRISSLIPTEKELESMICTGTHINGKAFSYNIDSFKYIDGATKALYKGVDNNNHEYIELLSVPSSGTYDDITVPEPGLYLAGNMSNIVIQKT
jgi:hypothetical protein